MVPVLMEPNNMEEILCIVPSVPVWTEGSEIIFDRKFYDGMLEYVKRWPGKIHCIATIAESTPPDFGLVKDVQQNLPFTIHILEHKERIEISSLTGASIVLAAGDDSDQLHISSLCNEIGVPCIYIIEYIPETRYQINHMDTRNPFLRIRRDFYIWNTERNRRSAFRNATGLQANGQAAFLKYRKLTNTISYYDTRIAAEDLISEEELHKRLETLSENRPLEISFSGRLITMKGADQLIMVAEQLSKRSVSYRLTIFGTGDLAGEMEDAIQDKELGDCVRMMGSVDFKTELIPFLHHEVDLFVMLHRQSDPSCTYLETLSCGVPIVGYLNRSFEGLLEAADIGWGIRVDNTDAVVEEIIRLNNERIEIAQKSIQARHFATNHDMEQMFNKRMDQLVSHIEG